MTDVPVWLLVCDELPDRRDRALAHLKERGIAPTVWKGFHGLTWGLETSKEYEPGKHLPPGHVGLNAGSWAMWQAAEKFARSRTDDDRPNATDPILFLEDDAVLPKDWRDRMSALWDDLDDRNPDWDLVFVGLAEREPQVWHKVTERVGGGESPLCRLNDPFGTHALLMRRRAIPVLLEHMRKAERNLDQQLFRDVLKPGLLNWCAVLPTIVRQRTFDYDGNGTPEWKASTLRPGEEDLRQEADREAAGRPPLDRYAASLALLTPYPCLYRGEPLLEHGRRADGPGSAPLAQCARFGGLPSHQKKFPVLAPDGSPALSCEACGARGETKPRGSRLPLPDGHFNPSMAMWQGRLVFATRDSWGHSKVALWEARNSQEDWLGEWALTPIGSYASEHPEAPRLEDPRLFVAVDPVSGQDRLHCAFNLPDGYPPKLVQVGYCVFAKDLSGIDRTEVMKSPFGNAYEKNWMPLPGPDGLAWLYSSKPRHLVFGPRARYETRNELPWAGGVIRGGAPPVRHGGELYHFFHGCIKRIEGSVYTMGCQVLEAEPPYRVLRQTPTPLMFPDPPDPNEDVVKRFVLWPGGAVPHAGRWFFALGIDDTFCRIDSLSFEQVEVALSAASGADGTASVRDTSIATGVKRGAE